MQEQLMKKAAVYWALFFLIAMSLMSFMIIKRDTFGMEEPKHTDDTEEVQQTFTQVSNSVIVPLKSDPTNQYFCIPVSVDVTEEGFFVENNYLERKLIIEIDGLEVDFYQKNQLYGNSSNISKVEYGYQYNKTYLTLTMNDYFECDVLFKNKCLFLKFTSPQEKYKKRIMIDLGTGKKNEDIPIQVANQIRDLLEDDKVKVYYSRLDEITPGNESVSAFTKAVNADMMILIHMNRVENPEETGIAFEYNPEYFIPFLGNAELTELLIENVTKATGKKIINITALVPDQTGTDENLLAMVTCPATLIQINYYDSEDIEQIMEDTSYLNNLAQGIADTVQTGYSILGAQ
ncbi:MAG: N-acetylmuramoyl-L-alanine amidase [Lachnospiraceae bacterium]|nr:N-acetylmuramoyl-L-alanine amidase [Lachnospiraceae bacterium]MDD3660576.1 N-acetylmuramoyl-L-alanine amidase [Lachnospiraceae bacterium]